MPPIVDDADWSGRCRDALSRYSAPLLRDVAAQLVRPRVKQPADELLRKSVEMLTNPPAIDRRVRELSEASRKLLALIGLSRQPLWRVGHLLAMLSALGHDDGIAPVEEALRVGLLFPDLSNDDSQIDDLTDWLGRGGMQAARVFAHPAVAARARGEDLGLPDLSKPSAGANARQADGLDWPLRLAAVWQQVLAAPVRLTQANQLFKKDLARLQADEVLSGQWSGEITHPPDLGVLALLWAVAAGLLVNRNNELTAAPFSPTWDNGLTHVLGDLFAALLLVESWDPLAGYLPVESGLSTTPTAGFLALLLLAKPAPNDWIDPAAIADWLWTHHPSWAAVIPPDDAGASRTRWVANWLLGVAYPLGLIEASPGGDNLVRLSPLGRHLLIGRPAPPAPPAFPQTLLVQPNAEILAYRQGLTPPLIATLSRFARWKGLGPACTLELTAEQTYRGLESGMTLPMMTQTLSRHTSRPLPPAVADLLQRWASKRERITIYSSAVLVEFATPAELDTAVQRGIVSVRLTDRIGMTADGAEPELSQLRLVANRDYEAKPQRCVTVGQDGVTLTIDPAAADLLLDAEIVRFATPEVPDSSGSRRYRLTPGLLRQATEVLSLPEIDAWFTERTGVPLSPAGRLFLLGSSAGSPMVARTHVMYFPESEIADGVMQWPETARLIAERLGPRAVAIAEENLEPLQNVLAGIGIRVEV